MSVTLYVEGNWTLERGTVVSDPKVYTYIKHTTCATHGPYRHGSILEMVCSGCKEAAPEGLIALYHFMVWEE